MSGTFGLGGGTFKRIKRGFLRGDGFWGVKRQEAFKVGGWGCRWLIVRGPLLEGVRKLSFK